MSAILARCNCLSEAPLILRDIQLAAMGALDRLCTFSTT